jgi:predicted dehydrogenase
VGLELERPEFYRKELDLLMSTSYGPGRYDRRYEELGQDYPLAYVRWTLNRNLQAYLELVAQGKVRPEGFVDRVVPLAEATRFYQELASGQGDPPVGVLLSYGGEERESSPPAPVVHLRGARKPGKDAVAYALVGVGAFGTSMLVPLLSRLGGRFSLKAVVSRDPVRGGNYARTQGVEVVATDLEPVLSDPEIQMVVIATRHHEHAEQVVRCLQAGKHVFVEKPLALTWQELDQVVEVYQGLEEPPLLMVGFNRRFSPAIQELARHLADRRSPLVINYRLAAGYLPPEHWVQDERGGGRNRGEACHMYDLFRFLSGAPPRSLGAAAIDPGGLPYLRTDNFCASLTYQDGSLATLTYTALGPSQGLGKERMEVFCDGECYLLDDYRRLVRISDGQVLWESEQPDKGHQAEISAWARALRGAGPAPISFPELVETTGVALELEDILTGKAD